MGAGTSQVLPGDDLERLDAGFSALHVGLTDVFAFNDLVALGACRAARRLGLTIPGAVAVLGFDGLSLGELLDPPLTTIRIDRRRMAELAVTQAQRLPAGEPTGRPVLETELPVGSSAGANPPLMYRRHTAGS